MTAVADKLGRDVLVTARILLHRRYVQAALMGERRGPYIGRVAVRRPVEALIHQVRNMGQPRKAVGIDPGLEAHLHRQCRHQRHQVGVAATLTETVERTLHLTHAGTHGGKRIGHRVVGVVVAVNAKMAARNLLGDVPDDALDLVGQGAAVGIAQHDPPGPGVIGGLDAPEGVIRVRLVTIEEVLGVENHFVDLLAGHRDAVGDDVDVLLRLDTEGDPDVEIPGLADDGRDPGLGGEQGDEAGIVLRAPARPSRHAEDGKLGMDKIGHRGVESVVRRVGAGPAALDVIDAEPVEFLGDGDLVVDVEVNPLGLGAIAQCTVVKIDPSIVAHPPRLQSLVPSGKSSNTIPLTLSLSRIRSASAKSRLARALLLAMTSTSISSSSNP